MKKSLIPIVLVLSFAVYLINLIRVEYEWNSKYESFWNISIKQSTLEGKEQYVNKFLAVIEENKHSFASYDAIILTTPNNSLSENIKALSSLSKRLGEIQQMDAQSFAYNTAIEQITKQEQGEADHIIRTLKGCWLLGNHPMYWDWIRLICVIAMVLVMFVAMLVAILADLKC